jgi:hypothetical protein
MTGVKSPCHHLQQAWGRAADHYATHTGTIRTIHACVVYETTTLGHYSHDQDKIAPQFLPPRPCPSTPVKLQGQTRAIGPGMTGHVATIPKDRNHSLNSGPHAWTRSNSARSTDAMPPQYGPHHHRIRTFRGLQAPPLARVTPKAGRKTRSSLARSARGWLGSARLGSAR